MPFISSRRGRLTLAVFIYQRKFSLEETMPFEVPPLPYAYNALEVSIDEQTMHLHHDKHHQAYVDNLNKALEKHPDLQKKSVDDILRDINSVPEEVRTAVRNNGGGHYNHSMFWKIMKPQGGGEPTGKIADVIKDLGGLAAFQEKFNDAGVKRFGSGWAWLVRSKAGKFEIVSTANQDSPLMDGNFPIMGNDVWEHAYYLRYQNKRADYLKAWWNVVNWEEINKRLDVASRG
jgi:Fe-Mn family superoxide dismutase